MRLPAIASVIAVCAGALLLSISSASADDKPKLPDATEILKRAESALKGAKVVRCRFTREGLHDDAEKTPKASGTVVMSGFSRNFVEKFRLEATLDKAGEAEKAKLTAGADGEVFYLFDYKDKKVYADMDPAVFGSQSEMLFAYVPQTFVNPEPFDYEKRAEKIEVRGIVSLNGEDCYDVRFAFGGGHFEAAYLFSIKDGLPKRFEWVWDGPTGGRQGHSLVISDLTLDAPASADAFKLTIPAGFTRTDEFAP